MADLTPYIERHPGDMVTAEDWNQVQIDIKEDIGSQVQTTVEEAIAAIVRVPEADKAAKADDADKLVGNTLDQLINMLVDKVIALIPSKVGYMQIFKKLQVGEQNVVEHGLEAQPLVDLYQLEYFRVVSTEGAVGDVPYDMWVNFYLYHSSEKRIRFRPEGGGSAVNIDIEPPDGPPYRIAFEEMLSLYNVQYTEDTSLADLENEFWKAFFDAPNDEFDDDQYTHSPWFDKCCREEESVRSIKRKGNWDDIWFQMRPRKTINFSDQAAAEPPVTSSPNQVEVVHFDLNTLALNLLADPVHPIDPLEPISGPNRDISQEMKVMLVLKV